MTVPNLFILGAQKAGTTYLAKVLSDHPEVQFSDPKETMFFSKNAVLTNKDYRDYCEKYFSNAEGKRWHGEGSTTYLQWQHAFERLQQFVGGSPRFIVCLRQPVEKAISFFIHNWRRGRYKPGETMTQALNYPITLSPEKTSLYADSIARWMDAYPRENFLFLKFDDLNNNPAHFVRQATEFLEISEIKNVPSEPVNVGFPLCWDGKFLTLRKKEVENRPRFSLEELSDLQNKFIPDLRKTEELTGLDLKDWYSLPRLAPIGA